jgi:hypothetical protein
MDDSVVKKAEQLFTCCVATEESRQSGKGSPPWVIFKWGGMTGFTSYVASGPRHHDVVSRLDQPDPQRFTVKVSDAVRVRFTVRSTYGVPPGGLVAIGEIGLFGRS